MSLTYVDMSPLKNLSRIGGLFLRNLNNLRKIDFGGISSNIITDRRFSLSVEDKYSNAFYNGVTILGADRVNFIDTLPYISDGRIFRNLQIEKE